LTVSSRLPLQTIDALTTLGHPVERIDEALLAGGFASPVGISRSADGMLQAAADAWYFPASAKVLA
jgi:hypothetical protein